MLPNPLLNESIGAIIGAAPADPNYRFSGGQDASRRRGGRDIATQLEKPRGSRVRSRSDFVATGLHEPIRVRVPMTVTTERSKPVLAPEFCKGCGRCIDSCAHHCIEAGADVHPRPASSRFLSTWNAARDAVCARRMSGAVRPAPCSLQSVRTRRPGSHPGPIRRDAVLPSRSRTVVRWPKAARSSSRGLYASAIGAMLAGCRHFFGYPITPSTEGAELMAKLLPRLDGAFLQAVSEVAAINMMYGAGARRRADMTFTSSPGFSLMLEGISYMIGARGPGVFVNVMRGGPGLGNIGPEQATSSSPAADSATATRTRSSSRPRRRRRCST